jgi:hypothetical protein
MIQPVTVAIVVAFAVANGDLDRPGISAVERVGLGPAWVPGFPVLCLETRIAPVGHPGLRGRPRSGHATSSETAEVCLGLTSDNPPRTVLR